MSYLAISIREHPDGGYHAAAAVDEMLTHWLSSTYDTVEEARIAAEAVFGLLLWEQPNEDCSGDVVTIAYVRR